MRKQYLDPEAIISSLALAFASPSDLDASEQRLLGMLSHLPSDPLYIMHDRRQISYYRQSSSGRTYLRKRSEDIYPLARSRYLKELLLTLRTLPEMFAHPDRWDLQFQRLANLIRDFAGGNLDVARIVLSQKQYSWFTGNYRKKNHDNNDFLPLIGYDYTVSSKSEQNIGHGLWQHAVPMHYEESLRINVQSLVDELVSYMIDNGSSGRNLFYYRGGVCYWNVPKELQFMNNPGSLWHTYDYKTGCVSIHPDFTIMLADGSLVYWEHEGLLEKPIYRINAQDRVSVMRFCGGLDSGHLIQTSEYESTDRMALERIIRKQLIPRLWL